MKLLLLNGGKEFGHSKGRLNNTLHETAKKKLEKLGHEVRQTIIDDGYEIEKEIEKFLWMDAVIWQMPGWWMGEPWIVKKYMDDVFTAGHGKLYESDGRHSDNPTKNYGKGGLVRNKKCMLSLTWNAPLEAFEDKNEFFGGVGVDGVYLHFLKANEFLGIKALPTFMCNDVMKSPDIPKYIDDYEKHLKKVFG